MRARARYVVVGGAVLWVALALANPYADKPAADPFHWDAKPLAVAAGDKGTLVLDLVVPKGFHVYRDQIDVGVTDAGGLTVGPADLPPGLFEPDPATGGRRELYDLDVVVDLPVSAPATASGLVKVELDVRHQGCSGSLCYPAVTTRLEALVHVTRATP